MSSDRATHVLMFVFFAPSDRVMWLTLGAFLVFLLTRNDIAAIHVDPKVLDGCPGYRAINVQTRPDGLTAYLVLGGKPCNVFGADIRQLSLNVDYETSMFSTTIQHTLHI